MIFGIALLCVLACVCLVLVDSCWPCNGFAARQLFVVLPLFLSCLRFCRAFVRLLAKPWRLGRSLRGGYAKYARYARRLGPATFSLGSVLRVLRVLCIPHPRPGSPTGSMPSTQGALVQPPLLRQRASHTSHTLHISPAPWQSHGEHAKQKRKQDSKKWKYNKQLSGCKAFIRPARVNQK